MAKKQAQARVLIIDDDHDVLLTARMFLEQLEMEVGVLADPARIPKVLISGSYDVILLDMNFRRGATEGREGLNWLNTIRELDPEAVVILMTAFGDVDLAVQGIKAGAFDFILKPWQNAKLHASILSAFRMKKTHGEKDHYRHLAHTLAHDSAWPHHHIIGQSPAMQKLRDTIRTVGPTEANVLVLGENGTGKELVARAIHRESPRRQAAFIGVDMGAIPETLFESELFGYRKGAFTGAVQDKPGRFEVAEKGSLFLDEIGNIPPALQSKLLTVIEQRHIIRLGTQQEIPIDIRLISATNQPLSSMCEEGRFRRDLLYRLNTIELLIPPLRERREDIQELATHFLKESCQKYGKALMELPRKQLKLLMQYHWPGNIRELQNTMARAVILSENHRLSFDHLVIDSNRTSPDSLRLDDHEIQLIHKALQANRGNVTRAASDLGIDRNALYRRMKKYGIQ